MRRSVGAGHAAPHPSRPLPVNDPVTVLTIAIGSLLASTSVSRDPSYAQGLTVLVALLALQLGWRRPAAARGP
ncbi:MAG: hypothetical protein M3203_15405 [Actinomycetota bacterium]|nr:hypothetical protein [Actinomycetota bacterium]